MRRKPWPLNLYAFVLLGIALSFPVQLAWLYEVPLSEIRELGRLLTDLNMLTMTLLFASSVAALKGSKATLYLAPLTAVAVVFNNWWVGYVGSDFSMWQTALASAAFLALSYVPFHGKVFAALKNPQMQWWRSAPRVQIEAPVFILDSRLNQEWLSDPDPIEAKTFDLSTTGAFLTVPTALRLGVEVGDIMQVKIRLSDQPELVKKAKVVRKASARGSYPDGIGVQFL